MIKKRIKYYLILAATGFTFQSSHAQIGKHDWRDYKLADVRLQQLNTSLDFRSYDQKDKLILIDSSQTNTSNLINMFNAQYSIFSNTRKTQRFTSINFNFQGNRGVNRRSTANNTNGNRNYNWETNIGGTDLYRRYYKNDFFFSLEPMLNYEFEQFFSRNDTDPSLIIQNTGDAQIFSFGMPVRFGKGRVERIEDSRQALYIIQNLQKNNRLSDSLTKQDLFDLAAHISRLRNKRFFDTRLQRNYQLKAIDSFLVANNWTTQTDALYYITTMDYWMFGGLPVRNNGHRLNAAVLPMTARHYNRTSNFAPGVHFERMEKNETNQLFYGIEYLHEKALSPTWQSTTQAHIYRGNYSNTRIFEFLNNDREESINYPGWNAELKHILGFYPRTRTFISWTNSVKQVRIRPRNISSIRPQDYFLVRNQDWDFFLTNFTSKIQATYYASPRFRIYADVTYFKWQTKKLAEYRGFVNSVYEHVIPTSFLNPEGLISRQTDFYTDGASSREFSTNITITYSLF